MELGRNSESIKTLSIMIIFIKNSKAKYATFRKYFE